MAAFVGDLPPEILLLIFDCLSCLKDILNFSLALASTKHEALAVRLFLAPQLSIFATLDVDLRKLLQKDGWTEDINNSGLIIALWGKYKPWKGNKTTFYFSRPKLTGISSRRHYLGCYWGSI